MWQDHQQKQQHDQKDSAIPSSEPPTQPTTATRPPAGAPSAVALPDTTRDAYARPSSTSQRTLKQLGLFFAGAGFLGLSTLVTRRSVVKKRLATIPSFYTPSNRPVNTLPADSSLIALEALSLATLNVTGFGIMCTGGLSWAFDISSLEDLRQKSRRHLGESGGHADEEAEKEIEEWVTKMLGRKEESEDKAGSLPKKDT
ncbi:hypothetical protein SLS62_001499 [Diatrype stigma]|uniref:Altered inheritance of mitochondria protein 11 n=1 Tax=Diatrype stigma TaxID=117547 RepID=A0AAN9YVY8_9PEZI